MNDSVYDSQRSLFKPKTTVYSFSDVRIVPYHPNTGQCILSSQGLGRFSAILADCATCDVLAHKAMPIHAALCFAGSVESLIVHIDVTM